MIRSELAARIAAEYPDLTQADAERVVQAIFRTIEEQLVEGGRVELRGFGSFIVRHRGARKARNPRTGESVRVEAKAVPRFRPGKDLRDRLNPE